jgi:hypothetical protein
VLTALLISACGGASNQPSADGTEAATSSTLTALPAAAVTGRTADDPLYDPRLGPDAPSVARCAERWNRRANAELRAEVARDGVTDRAYVYQMEEMDVGASLDDSIAVGACALTFAADDGEDIKVEWFLERGLTGRFRSVSEMGGPFFSLLQPGNAGVGADGSLQLLV